MDTFEDAPQDSYDEIHSSLLDSLLSSSFEVELEENKESGAYYLPSIHEEHELDLPLFEEEDRDILMHRDAHFSGSFDLMYEYYRNEGKGAVLPIDIRRIQALSSLEKHLGKNLAPFALSGKDAEIIARSRKLYRGLKDLYEREHKPNDPLVLIADLILSEEEDPQVDADVIAQHGISQVPYLLQLLATPEFFDALYPGYGLAPISAVLALGKLKAESAIRPIFSLLGTTDFELESACLEALRNIGDKAKELCIQMLFSKPITLENQKAAIALLSFSCDLDCSKKLIEALKDKDIQKNETLLNYIALACESLPQELQGEYIQLASMPSIPKSTQDEMLAIIRSWKKR